MKKTYALLILLLLCAISPAPEPATTGSTGPAPRLKAVPIESPAPVGSLVPQVTPLASSDLVLSWQEPLQGGGYAFCMATRTGSKWSKPVTIARGPDLSMFTADLPGVVENAPGSWLAYWEIKDLRGTRTDTLIQIATSSDQGRSWSHPDQPHHNSGAGEHSFIAAFPEGRNTGLVWLDTRDVVPSGGTRAGGMARMENMEHSGMETGRIGLRYVAVDANREVKEDAFIDLVTCECCPNSAPATSRGPVVVYRGRKNPSGTKNAVRDIHISRLENGHWTRPHTVFDDHWVIDACPDNGPAVEARGTDVAVAWWTRAGDQRKVQIAFSRDAGDSFALPVRVDQGGGEGQVTLAWIEGRDAVAVGWLEDHKVWARVITRSGEIGPPVAIGASPGHSRLPRWVWRDGGLFAAYTADIGGERRAVRAARLDLEAFGR